MTQSFRDGHRVVWLSPSPSADRAAGLVAQAVGAQAVIAAKGLEVWSCDPPTDYSMRSEIEGVTHLARSNAWDSFHLIGFSAGATVALALALDRPTAVKTLCLIEPAYIGDDDWSPNEAAYRAAISESYSLPADVHQDAFRKAVMHPDEPPLPPHHQRLEICSNAASSSSAERCFPAGSRART